MNFLPHARTNRGGDPWVLTRTAEDHYEVTTEPHHLAKVFLFNSKSKCFTFLPLQSPDSRPRLHSILWEIKDTENQSEYH